MESGIQGIQLKGSGILLTIGMWSPVQDPEFTAWNAESKKTGSDHLTWGRENRGKCMCTSHGDIVDGLRAFQNKSKKNSGKVKVL